MSSLEKTKHPHLFRDTTSGVFYYRRYSSLKKKQYFKTTGEKQSAARAYKFGLEAFNDWIGKVENEAGETYFDRYAERFLDRRLENDALRNRTKILSEYEVKQLIDGFGHLRLEQITAERYEDWVKDRRRAGDRKKFFNARKALIQILRGAQADGYLQRVPRFPHMDAPPAPPQYLPRHSVRRILKNTLSPDVKLLAFMIWKQGGRPGEILQYEWRMIHWDEGKHGQIHIPGRITKTGRARVIPLNSRVSRVLRRVFRARKSDFIFPQVGDKRRHREQYFSAWRAACARAGVEGHTIYTLRDTFVTNRLKAGQSLAFIAKYVDSSPKQLAERYAVAEEEAMRGVAG